MAIFKRISIFSFFTAMITASVLAILPQTASAIQNYRGNVSGECVTTDGVTTDVTAKLTSPGWTMAVMTYTFQPGNHTYKGSDYVDPNDNTVAHFPLPNPPSSYTVYVGTPTPTGTPVGPNSSDIQAHQPVTVPTCGTKLASLSVAKTVINTTGRNVTGTVFPVQVNCNHTTTTLNLSSTLGYTQSVQNLPVPSTCNIVEQPVVAPAGCYWVTTYPRGQSTVLSQNAGYILPVQNELKCRIRPGCPDGTTEQIWPGTKIKFCCKEGALDPKSKQFCCTREIIDPVDHKKDMTATGQN